MKDRTNRISDLLADDGSDNLPVVLLDECDDDSAWQRAFQGGVYDDAAALYNFAPRDFSPTLARWVEPDPHPAAYIEGVNLYPCADEIPAPPNPESP